MYKLCIASLLVTASLNAAELQHNTDEWLENQISTSQDAKSIWFGFNNDNEFCLGTDCGCNKRLSQCFQKHQENTNISIYIDYTQVKELAQIMSVTKNCRLLVVCSQKLHTIPADNFRVLMEALNQNSNLDISLLRVQPQEQSTYFLNKEFNKNKNLKSLRITSTKGWNIELTQNNHISMEKLQNNFARKEQENEFCITSGLCLDEQCGCLKTVKQFFENYHSTLITVGIPPHKLKEFAKLLPFAGNYRVLTIKNDCTRSCWYAADDIHKLIKEVKKNTKLEALYLVSAYETSLGTFLFTNLFNECPNIKTLQYNNKASFTSQD